MKVYITQTAKNCLRDIYIYHCDYSERYAEKFYSAITHFIIDNLSELPEMGHVHNKRRNLYRVIFKDYNIYYAIRDKDVYVLYIIDGKLSFNDELREN